MLKMRMQILKQAGVISEEVAAFMDQVIDTMGEVFPGMSQEKAEMFTTHLAMATERIRKGEAIDGLEDAIWEEVAQSEEYPQARAFFDQMMAVCPVEFPENESRFMLLHICSILND